jgi:uncharacterized protein involved in response to NO
MRLPQRYNATTLQPLSLLHRDRDALAEALHAYIAAAGIGADKKAFLFRTSRGHAGTALSDPPMTQVGRLARKVSG